MCLPSSFQFWFLLNRGLRTLKVQWQRPTVASPLADRAHCREYVSTREAATTPVVVQSTSSTRDEECHATSTPPVEMSSPSSQAQQPAACSLDTRTLAPGWAVYCNDRGQHYFWDAENQAGR